MEVSFVLPDVYKTNMDPEEVQSEAHLEASQPTLRDVAMCATDTGTHHHCRWFLDFTSQKKGRGRGGIGWSVSLDRSGPFFHHPPLLAHVVCIRAGRWPLGSPRVWPLFCQIPVDFVSPITRGLAYGENHNTATQQHNITTTSLHNPIQASSIIRPPDHDIYRRVLTRGRTTYELRQ